MSNGIIVDMLQVATFKQALTYHLRHNTYPPVSEIFNESIDEAINACALDDGCLIIQLPGGIEMKAKDLVKDLHLEPFVYHLIAEEEDKYNAEDI